MDEGVIAKRTRQAGGRTTIEDTWQWSWITIMMSAYNYQHTSWAVWFGTGLAQPTDLSSPGPGSILRDVLGE